MESINAGAPKQVMDSIGGGMAKRGIAARANSDDYDEFVNIVMPEKKEVRGTPNIKQSNSYKHSNTQPMSSKAKL